MTQITASLITPWLLRRTPTVHATHHHASPALDPLMAEAQSHPRFATGQAAGAFLIHPTHSPRALAGLSTDGGTHHQELALRATIARGPGGASLAAFLEDLDAAGYDASRDVRQWLMQTGFPRLSVAAFDKAKEEEQQTKLLEATLQATRLLPNEERQRLEYLLGEQGAEFWACFEPDVPAHWHNPPFAGLGVKAGFGLCKDAVLINGVKSSIASELHVQINRSSPPADWAEQRVQRCAARRRPG